MKPIIGYARVSTEEQASTHALEQQKARLGDAGATEIYFDIESGRNPDRPQLLAVLELVMQKKVSAVICTRWDRLLRNSQLYSEIKKIFQVSGVRLIFLDQGEVDLSSASGELNSDLQVLFAVHESRMLRERVSRGLDYRRSREAACSRPPWGYEVVDEKYKLDWRPFSLCWLDNRPDNYLELYREFDDSQKLVVLSRAKIAREIIDYFLKVRKPTLVLKYLHETYGLHKNAALNPPEFKGFPLASDSLKYWLQNPVLQGHTAYHKLDSNRQLKPKDEWDIRRDTHPEHRLVSEEEGREIEAILASNRKRFGQPDATFYLTGLVFCEKCHSKCSLKGGRGRAYYGCRHSATVCDNRKLVTLFEIEQAIIAQLVQRALEIHQTPETVAQSKKLVELEKQYYSLDQIAGSDFNPVLKEAKEKIRQAIDVERNQAQGLAYQLLCHPSARKINFWYTLTQSEREAFYELFLSRVVIGEGKVISVLLQV